jgi:hypothetical protein
MSWGMRIWDRNGKIVFDTTSRIGRIIGYVDTGEVNGEITDLRLTLGEPFFVASPIEFLGFEYYMPRIVITGSTLSWAFTKEVSPYNLPVPSRIMYGTF